MDYSIGDIADIIKGERYIRRPDDRVDIVAIDSRKISRPHRTVFFALRGTMTDGHDFVERAYQMGVRQFVVDQHIAEDTIPEANQIVVSDTMLALRILATYHRSNYADLRAIGITGSNGKTVVKEWLYQMLHDRFHIAKSPKSYNSQLGMTLSILGIAKDHNLGIFEAGISLPGEMQKHHDMLQPQIGLITNIGAAHDEGFSGREQKLREKMLLFGSADTIIYCQDHEEIDSVFLDMYGSSRGRFTWGHATGADLQIQRSTAADGKRSIALNYRNEQINIVLHLTDAASYQNIMHCLAVLAYLQVPIGEWQERISRVSGLPMRLEMTEGVEGSILINDAYTADLESLKMAIDFVKEQLPDRRKIAIMTSFDQVGKHINDVATDIALALNAAGYSQLFFVGNRPSDLVEMDMQISYFDDKASLLSSIAAEDIRDAVVLIKGARKYRLEDITRRLSARAHSATLHIDLNAIEHNLRVYKAQLKNGAGIIAVIKASAYGSGSAEVARLLQNSGVDYLAVAFGDEGIALRKSGVTAPIMVLNPDIRSLSSIVRYDLQPEIYTMSQLEDITAYCNRSAQAISIHLKLDSGMHRLGFLSDEIGQVSRLINNSKWLSVETVFSHLASSEVSDDDGYTKLQCERFEGMADRLSEGLGYSPKRHILNSAGISRFPEMHMDYVRLGIGLYGVDTTGQFGLELIRAHRLTANLIQVKDLKAGDSIGYNRKTILEKDTQIGIVNIGYADGLMRSVSNRSYALMIDGCLAPILGNVCMDLTIIDLSEVDDAQVGDEVVIFDHDHPLEALAQAAGSIPYEVLSRISSRVQRMFVRG